jgi:hypothetical protein
MEHDGSLLSSYDPTSSPYSEPDETIQHPPILSV